MRVNLELVLLSIQMPLSNDRMFASIRRPVVTLPVSYVHVLHKLRARPDSSSYQSSKNVQDTI